MSKLHTLHVRGFKSIRDQKLELDSLNVFIGGNGAGKSNLVGVFHLLNRVANQQLQIYTGEAGGANALLHFGRKYTSTLSIRTEFHTPPGYANIYEIKLNPTDEDRFVFESEITRYWNMTLCNKPYIDELWSGHMEAHVAESKKPIAQYIRGHLRSYRIYHFHDTSSSARVKQTGDLADSRFLREDAANLAAFLYMLEKREPNHFQNIVETVRQVAPFLKRFKLEPSALNPDKIRLEWEENSSDTYFSAAALSDGTLRFICLATLLLQPMPPSIIIIDEPELGLHPAAIQVLAGLLESAATRTQLIVATQSVTLINQLRPEHVWVVDREDGQSIFRHLKAADMSAWLEDYGLGELWEKNILGGRP
ncbi:MAG: AAA family ATPase [candidate division KSB1 bacterium]|nr:AAA family ATPase [candidate division KSB1 bacterium]MDZ7365093.1 AAA family ATPase [candidate division KSB1 bacterium]MDZ7404303.1 AAA family ATPase [candidate division KSB1 bacterium]